MKQDLRTQCLLMRDGSKQTAWIDKPAEVGRIVEIKETGEYWTIAEVYDTIDAAALKTHQDAARTHRKATDV